MTDTEVHTVDTERALAAAAAAAPVLPTLEPRVRAAALVAAAEALDAAADELVPIAMSETGLAEARLRGELKRTTVQLRLFAEVVADGGYLDVRLDAADPAFALGPRPDLRRYLVPLGPVLNFAASNFPFAFSVAGGDTAAALAAGSPVVVKAHSGHPELSRRVAAIVSAALTDAGMPEGTLGLIEGQAEGVAALRDSRIAAASFTGSTHAGTFLAGIAASRPEPIPFFGELGSVNPVFVTPAALADAEEELAKAYVASVSGSAGQLCTKSGFVFVPGASGFAGRLAPAAEDVAEHRLLNPGIAAGYTARRSAILATPGVETLVSGNVRSDGENSFATPTFVATDVATLREHRSTLLEEAFGPLSIVVAYDDPAELPGLVAEFFPGNLTGTVQLAPDDTTEAVPELLASLAKHSGRVLVNGWPTGVAVTDAMEHGGPFPATTSGGTSVGTAAIGRFLRGVSYQNVPQSLLPEPLRDSNPWNVPQRRAAAGESVHWGELARSV